MGANQYTPDTDMMRGRYIDGKHYQSKYPNQFFAGADNAGEEFDLWLEQVRAEAKAEAWQEAYNYGLGRTGLVLHRWLRARAEQVKEGA